MLSQKRFKIYFSPSWVCRVCYAPEQKDAISSLVHGSDLLAVLPTGFGKSLIFQLLIRVKQILSSKTARVIVVCALKSIVLDQLTEASLMDLTTLGLLTARPWAECGS